MIIGIRVKCLTAWVAVFWLCVCFLPSDDAFGGAGSTALQMPAHWKVISNHEMPAEQLESMSNKLGAALSSVRNAVYDVNGKRVQINVIVTPDPGNTEKLMTKLRSMKADEALLRKGLTVYEFVGQNDVLSVIAEGRKHLDSK